MRNDGPSGVALDEFVGLLGIINVLVGHRASGEPRGDEDVVRLDPRPARRLTHAIPRACQP
jgi:hypothetical protein